MELGRNGNRDIVHLRGVACSYRRIIWRTRVIAEGETTRVIPNLRTADTLAHMPRTVRTTGLARVQEGQSRR